MPTTANQDSLFAVAKLFFLLHWRLVLIVGVHVCVLECWSWGKCLWPIIGWCVITISNLSWDVVLSSYPLGAWQHCKLICRQHNQLCLHQLISPPPIQWYHLQSLFCHQDLVSSLHKKNIHCNFTNAYHHFSGQQVRKGQSCLKWNFGKSWIF